MRLLVAFSLVGFFAACSGDSSSVMSSWNDETGGQSGGATGGSSGAGGRAGAGGNGGAVTTSTGGVSGDSIVVRGGTRDPITAQCTATSNGGGCPVDTSLLSCMQGPCGSSFSDCFQGTNGPCGDYAACMFNCPCDSGRSTCENACLSDKGWGSETCSPKMVDLLVCWSNNGCAVPTCLLN
jgi:hypothetical protein